MVKAWRRSYDVPPPPLPEGDSRWEGTDPRYRDVPAALVPAHRVPGDVVARTLPYFDDVIVPDLLAQGSRGGAVLVVAHGNSLRALRKHLEQISDEEIAEDRDPDRASPTAMRLGEDLSFVGATYLGDPEAARSAAEATAKQAG